MKPVESFPARQRGCAISAARKGMLWRMPSIAKASRASACASIATSRGGACVTSLAIIRSDQIDPGDELGHRMLDLQPRVHLEEVKALVLPGDELNGACAVVAHGLCERDRLLAHLLADRGVEQRRWRFLDDFLVAALDRAFAL